MASLQTSYLKGMILNFLMLRQRKYHRKIYYLQQSSNQKKNQCKSAESDSGICFYPSRLDFAVPEVAIFQYDEEWHYSVQQNLDVMAKIGLEMDSVPLKNGTCLKEHKKRDYG